VFAPSASRRTGTGHGRGREAGRRSHGGRGASRPHSGRQTIGEIRLGDINTYMVTTFREYVARRQLAEIARAIGKFAQGGVFNEMAAARRSFKHSMGKFEPQAVDKPIAILTAWRGVLLDPATGQSYPEAVRRRLNDEANELLKANIRRRGLSFYPVVGAGQEQDEDGNWTANREDSFIVQPVGKMDDDMFRNHIRELLFDPTDEQGKGHKGPFPHIQDAATVKLTSQPQAFLLTVPDGQSAVGPQSYTVERPIGDSAFPRTPLDDYFTQMKYGPRADPGMMDQHDQPDDVGNPPPGMGKPGAGLPGRRFTIKDKKP